MSGSAKGEAPGKIGMANAVSEARSTDRRKDEFFPWLALVPLALIPAAGASSDNVALLIILMEGILFFFGARRPLWLLAALLVPELTIPNYLFSFGGFTVSNRLLLTVGIVIVILPHLTSGEWFSSRTRRVVLLALAFFVVAWVANVIGSDFGSAVKFGRFLTTGILSLLLVPAVVRTERDARDLAAVCLVLGAASALAAVLQHYSDTLAVPVLQAVPHAGEPLDFYDWGGRVLGLAESPIYLTSSLLLLLFPAMGVVLIGGLQLQPRRIVAVAVLLMLVALYFSFTRSWVYAVGLGIVPFLFLYKGRYSRELWALVILSAVSFVFWTEFRENRYSQGANEDSSASGRLVLWEIGLNIALDNPLIGVGHRRFTELSPGYASEVSEETLSRQDAAYVIGRYEPHNDFLNIWLSFGTGGLLLYGAILYLSAKNYLLAYAQVKSPFLKGLALGGLGALLAFMVNSSLHNLLDNTLTVWLLAGLSLALANIAVPEGDRVAAPGPRRRRRPPRGRIRLPGLGRLPRPQLKPAANTGATFISDVPRGSDVVR